MLMTDMVSEGPRSRLIRDEKEKAGRGGILMRGLVVLVGSSCKVARAHDAWWSEWRTLLTLF